MRFIVSISFSRGHIFQVSLIAAILLAGLSAQAAMTPGEWAFVDADYVLDVKTDRLTAFLERTHELAHEAAQDPVLTRFFAIRLQLEQLSTDTPAPQELVETVRRFDAVVSDHYVRNYYTFYDVLFVGPTGDIFHSIRKEADYRSNLLIGDASQTRLAAVLRDRPRHHSFVDFDFYAPSEEPAAFFVEPIETEGELTGWMVLQFAVNKVNSIFAGSDKLGPWGELLLVNDEGLMLTQSSFVEESTILVRHFDKEIAQWFEQDRIHRRWVDYRGRSTLASARAVRYMGAQWLAIAKVDKAQITTEHFCLHRRYYLDEIQKTIGSAAPRSSGTALMADFDQALRVDMDEFRASKAGELLCTYGVSTCTGFIATWPGHFGYLAHLSPLDSAYGQTGTDLTGQIIDRIKKYHVRMNDRRHVRFRIIARHFESLGPIVNEIVDEGFLLDQIDILCVPSAANAQVLYDYAEGRTQVVWAFDNADNDGLLYQDETTAFNVGRIVREHLND